jgi:hypothetical protein
MPFVLAPNLWRLLSLTSKRNLKQRERAHGDNVMVDADSPESLDEVFWRTFSGEEYIGKKGLQPHSPSDQNIDKYRNYVNAILSADSIRRERYLSKNNNNVLRLGAIQRAFPNVLILVPFREPLQQAYSLLRQHLRFVKLQAKDEFVLSYMKWLGHHEFGRDHKPFLFDNSKKMNYPITKVEYWLELWIETYKWLEYYLPESAVLVCYEDLCVYEMSWSRLKDLADIPTQGTNTETFELSSRPIDSEVDGQLVNQACRLYARLVERSRKQLSLNMR